jgi:CarD family transcriptional regulator
MKKINLKSILKKTFKKKNTKNTKTKVAKNKTQKVKSKIKKTKKIKESKKVIKKKDNLQQSVNKSENLRIVKNNEQKPEIKKVKKQESEKRIYKIKDYVVYPKHGVGQITEFKKINIGGIEVETYILKFEKDKANGMVPVNKQVNLRPLATINQVNKCISILKSKPKINSERQLFEKAYERLLTEIQIVMNSTFEDAQKKLDKALKRNLQSQTQKLEEVPKVKDNQEEISEEAQQ